MPDVGRDRRRRSATWSRSETRRHGHRRSHPPPRLEHGGGIFVGWLKADGDGPARRAAVHASKATRRPGDRGLDAGMLAHPAGRPEAGRHGRRRHGDRLPRSPRRTRPIAGAASHSAGRDRASVGRNRAPSGHRRAAARERPERRPRAHAAGPPGRARAGHRLDAARRHRPHRPHPRARRARRPRCGQPTRRTRSSRSPRSAGPSPRRMMESRPHDRPGHADDDGRRDEPGEPPRASSRPPAAPVAVATPTSSSSWPRSRCRSTRCSPRRWTDDGIVPAASDPHRHRRRHRRRAARPGDPRRAGARAAASSPRDRAS